MRKFYNVLKCIAIIFLFIGCRKEISIQEKTSNVTNNTKVEEIETSKQYKIDVNKFNGNSFVVSCGSGCAITYTAEEITKNKSSFKVKFSALMYIDESITETYNETYLFEFNKLNKLEKIVLEGETQNALETLPNNAKKLFLEFSEKLSKYL